MTHIISRGHLKIIATVAFGFFFLINVVNNTLYLQFVNFFKCNAGLTLIFLNVGVYET